MAKRFEENLIPFSKHVWKVKKKEGERILRVTGKRRIKEEKKL